MLEFLTEQGEQSNEMTSADVLANKAKVIADLWLMVAFKLEHRKRSIMNVTKTVDRILNLQKEWVTYEAINLSELLDELPKD